MLRGDVLWKLSRDHFAYPVDKRICFEVARSPIQCQADTDYSATRKTTGTIMPDGPWDTLSIDIVGPLPADRGCSILSLSWIVFLNISSWFHWKTTQPRRLVTLLWIESYHTSGFPSGFCRTEGGNSWDECEKNYWKHWVFSVYSPPLTVLTEISSMNGAIEPWIICSELICTSWVPQYPIGSTKC